MIFLGASHVSTDALWWGEQQLWLPGESMSTLTVGEKFLKLNSSESLVDWRSENAWSEQFGIILKTNKNKSNGSQVAGFMGRRKYIIEYKQLLTKDNL